VRRSHGVARDVAGAEGATKKNWPTHHRCSTSKKKALQRQQMLQRVRSEVEEQLAEEELRFFRMEIDQDQESDSEGTCNTRI